MKNTIDACILCHLCSLTNESYLITKDERRSTRHTVWLGREHVASPWLYAAMLNGRGERVCPLNINIDAEIMKSRKLLVTQGKETEANKKFMQKLRGEKNPYL